MIGDSNNLMIFYNNVDDDIDDGAWETVSSKKFKLDDNLCINFVFIFCSSKKGLIFDF